MFAWMEITGNEIVYEYFDEVLRICREHDVTLSLGDACRPGCLEDAGDIAQMEELVTLGELTQRAWAQDVQVIIEGPGHMPLHQIQANMELQKTICKGGTVFMCSVQLLPMSHRAMIISLRRSAVQWRQLRSQLFMLCDTGRALVSS